MSQHHIHNLVELLIILFECNGIIYDGEDERLVDGLISILKQIAQDDKWKIEFSQSNHKLPISINNEI